MKKVLSMLVVLLGASIVTSHETEVETSRDWCLKNQGRVVVFSMLDKWRRPNGIKKAFCVLKNPGEGTKTVGLETFFSEKETLACRFFLKDMRVPSIMRNHLHPGYQNCIDLGGLDSTWKNGETGGESGICVFPDGSMISDWAIFYGAEKLPQMKSGFKNCE